MLTEITQIIIAFAVSFIIYATIDVLAGLPKEGGVCGARAIGEAVEESADKVGKGLSSFMYLPNLNCLKETER